MPTVDAPLAAWQELGAVSPDALTDTRLELHWAAQLIAAAPIGFLRQTPDFSHANVGWIGGSATFVTRPVGSVSPVQVGLRLDDFSLVIFDTGDRLIDEMALVGRTLDEGYSWIAEMMDRHGVGTKKAAELHRPADDFPDHAVGSGAAFTGGAAAARAELARWYDDALFALSQVVRDMASASSVRTWPHHFDMATLIALQAAEGAEQMRSVGVGMTPGDSSYAEPYIYVVPWPYPQDPTLPSLAGNGSWHTEGWIGAVLTGSRLIEGTADGTKQAERARAFLASAIPAVRALVVADR